LIRYLFGNPRAWSGRPQGRSFLKHPLSFTVYPVVDIVPTPLAERLYRGLLGLFPGDFRRASEPELAAWFAAAWRDAGTSGAREKIRLAGVVLFDLLRSIPAEWLATLSSPRTRGDASSMETLLQDLRYAARSLKGTPIVMLVSALTIAIGVGATTTMFSVANALLLRPPVGVEDPGRLITVHVLDQKDGSSFHSFSYPDYKDLNEAGAGFGQLSAYTILAASVRSNDEPRLEVGEVVSANYFPILGAHTSRGRFFSPEEDQPGGPPVVVLSYSLWQRRFNSDPAILGKVINVNGHPLTVIGVGERGFRGHIAAIDFGLWAPMALMGVLNNRPELLQRRSAGLEIVGRLAPGVTRRQASEGYRAAAIRVGRDAGLDWDRGVDVRRYLPIPAMMALPAGGFLGLLIVLGGLVLLIASANVANMLLVRGRARGREIGVRLALGASRGRLVRQLVTESVMLFLTGGVLGTALAYVAVNALVRFQPPMPIPIALDFHLDYVVLLASLGITLAAGLTFGLLPALQATRTDLVAVLRDTLANSRLGRWRLRGAMVVAQVAGTAFLLIIAGLFVRALGRAGEVNLGFNPRGIQVMAMELQVRGYQGDKMIQFTDAVERRLAEVPGVTSVAASDFLPVNMSTQQTEIALDGKGDEHEIGVFETDFASVTPAYFATLEIPLKRGRAFTASDRKGAPTVGIVNEVLAERLWPGEDPIGKRLRFGGSDGELTEIVGVASNAKYRSLGDDRIRMFYMPIAQSAGRSLVMLVRMTGEDPSSAKILRRALADVDPEMPLSQEGSFPAIIAVALLPNRIAMVLATIFGLTGITLAAVGLYGLLAYRVQCRRKEIGIRMALGAGNGEVRRLVLREALGVTGSGLVLGLAVAGGATQLLRSLLFGLSPLDPITYSSIGLLLLLVCWIASAGPVRRALRTQPLEVLRNE
jgi:predicted permease